MKSILISIKPQYVADILNEYKLYEIRKTKPKCERPCKVYIYCTQNGRPLVYGQENACVSDHYTQTYNWSKKDADKIWGALNGKVVAEFTLKNITTFNMDGIEFYGIKKQLLQCSCLTEQQLKDYIKDKIAYGWKIDDLVIYDEPKQLCEFTCRKPLKRPPQSWCYVDEEG